MQLEDLKSLIRAAFQDVEYPGGDHIAGCSRVGCDECQAIAAHFKGTTWQEHNLQTLDGYDDVLPLFHTQARHYYLPAFLLADIGDDQKGEEPNSLSNLNIAFQFMFYEARIHTKRTRKIYRPVFSATASRGCRIPQIFRYL